MTTKYVCIREKEKDPKDYIISVCGDCPEMISGSYCIRKKTVVNPKKLYDRCPLPGK